MKRDQLVRMFVLEEISDDYEDLERISKGVNKLGARCGLTIAHQEILSALANLIEVGMANAYRLEATREAPKPLPGVPPDDEMEEYYFWITRKGREHHLAADSEWPFQDDGTLKPDWALDR